LVRHIRIPVIGTPIYGFHASGCVGAVYKPAEDSYILQRCVSKLVTGIVLDMGTGSGIQAVTAARKSEVTRVVAVDINPEAIEAAKKRASEAGISHKVTFKVSDLFEKIEERFDWIIFNPPYLPSEGDLKDPTWDGGERGVETIEHFLSGAKEHLTPGGSILMIYSSETGIAGDYGYDWEILEEVPLFFERLYCARLNLS
jgi:release factor glutamine methyltransferase